VSRLKKFSEDFVIEGCCECPAYNPDVEKCEHSDLEAPKEILNYTNARTEFFGFANFCPLKDYKYSQKDKEMEWKLK